MKRVPDDQWALFLHHPPQEGIEIFAPDELLEPDGLVETFCVWMGRGTRWTLRLTCARCQGSRDWSVSTVDVDFDDYDVGFQMAGLREPTLTFLRDHAPCRYQKRLL